MHKLLSFFLAFILIRPSLALDIFHAPTNQLSIPLVSVSGNIYSNVVITVGSVISVGNSPAKAAIDFFDPNTNLISIPSVNVGALTYFNVVATVGNVLSVGSSSLASFPLQQAMTYAYSVGLQNTHVNYFAQENNGSGKVTSTKGFLTYAVSPPEVTTFNGIVGISSISSINYPFNVSVTHFFDNQYSKIGQLAFGNYCVSITPLIFPSTISVGFNSSTYAFNCFTDSTKTKAAGTITESYSTSLGVNNTLDVVFSYSNLGTVTYNITSSGVVTIGQVRFTNLTAVTYGGAGQIIGSTY